MSNEQLVDYVEVYEDSQSEWRWRAKSSNGQVVATSGEGYQDHDYALKVAREQHPEAEVRDERAE